MRSAIIAPMGERGQHFGVIENPNWREVATYSHFLAEKIRRSGFYPDEIVGIQRGGVIPAALLSYRFGGKGVLTLQIEKDGEKRIVIPAKYIDLEALNGTNILLVEDMLETGRSARAGLEFLRDKGAIVRLACYFTRPENEIEPDFVLARNVKIPITFPWETTQSTT